MKLGILSGTGSDCCGTNFMSFTAHGWGHGLLNYGEGGRIPEFLLFAFSGECIPELTPRPAY
jgi:hypothetical protein